MFQLFTIRPTSSDQDETLSTLRYARRAAAIKNNVKVNIDTPDARLTEEQEAKPDRSSIETLSQDAI